jgi:phosphoglycerol transferase
LRIVALALFASVCWCYVTGRTDEATWSIPLEYGMMGADGDAGEALSRIKAASEGEYLPALVKNITRVGAPYYGNWSDYPVVEEWQFFLPGMLAKWIGVFAAANVAVMMAQVLACLCFYFTARLLDCKWWWAMAGGVAFGFAQFALARSIHHLTVTNYWYVPICILIAGWVARNQLGESRGGRYAWVLGASFFIGMQNPYYTNMFLQLTLLGAFYQYFRNGWKPVMQAGGIVAASAAGFIVMSLDTLIYHLQHGSNPGAIVREYRWLELSALKFVDLLIPPPDHSLLGGIGQAYYKMVAFPGEVGPSCYLGLAGIAALVWLAVVSVRRLVTTPGRNLPLETWQLLWILAYSTVGGLNCLGGVFGVTVFRSSTRYCIFILPIVLLFALRRLSQKRLDTETGVTLAGVCALLALWDQTPPVPAPALTEAMARVVDSDRQFTAQMEARLPKRAMVFQVPIMEFPETPSTIPAYDHFRPYLHSTDLRFSFGGVKGRPWHEWQKDVGKSQSLGEVIHSVESYGFAAIYVNGAGFQDKGAGIKSGFKQLGYSEMIESKRGDLFCVLIHPSITPTLPAGPVK